MLTQFILGLRNLVAKSYLSQLRAFGRHIYARMWWLEAHVLGAIHALVANQVDMLIMRFWVKCAL